MTAVNLPQGSYNLSIEKGMLKLTPLAKDNQESFVPASQQPNNRQPSAHLYTSALGLAGGVGLVVSCVWSILLPAIGSVGVMAFAYLVDRKITLLHAKELSLETAKSQDLFAQQIGSKVVSGSLLDEPAVGADNLPVPMSPMYNAINQSNIPLPMPGSGSLLDEPAVGAGNLPVPMSPMYNAINQSNILPPPPPPPPPPLPSVPPMPLTTSLLPKQKKECPKIDSSCIDSKKPGTSADPRGALLSSIINYFNFMQIKELLKGDIEKYPSNLLLKELKTTYERALAIGESKFFSKTYFKDKIDNFKKNFAIVEQEENQTTKEMEDICKKTSYLDSLLKYMKWAQSLLEVLSGREDLSDKTREHCSEKLRSIDKHIDKLQRHNEKKSEEPQNKEPNTEENSSQVEKNPGKILLKAFNEKFSQQSNESQHSNNNEMKNKEKTVEEVFQERYKANHGDGTSDNSDSEVNDSDWG